MKKMVLTFLAIAGCVTTSPVLAIRYGIEEATDTKIVSYYQDNVQLVFRLFDDKKSVNLDYKNPRTGENLTTNYILYASRYEPKMQAHKIKRLDGVRFTRKNVYLTVEYDNDEKGTWKIPVDQYVLKKVSE